MLSAEQFAAGIDSQMTTKLTLQQKQRLLRIADKSNSGSVDLEEFIALLKPYKASEVKFLRRQLVAMLGSDGRTLADLFAQWDQFDSGTTT